jgi:hypothetical protein
MVGLNVGLDVEGSGAVARAIGDLGGAKAACGGRDVDGFEKAGFAGAIAPQQEVRTGAGLPGEGLQVPEVASGEPGEQRSDPVRFSQILIGMMTQRYRVSGPSCG